MFGLAAGICGKVELGDVIIASEIHYYEIGKQKKEGFERRLNSANVDAYLKNSMLDFYSTVEPSLGFQVHAGPFTVGEKVISDNNVVAKLLENDPKLIGIEMESYGVAKAALSVSHHPRFIAIRGVCDFADEAKK